MKIAINSTVTFELARERKVTLEARELYEFKQALFETDGKPDPANPDGPRELQWPVIFAKYREFIKAKTGADDLSDGEVMGIFGQTELAWKTVKKNLLPPMEVPAASENSQPSGDPRYSD